MNSSILDYYHDYVIFRDEDIANDEVLVVCPFHKDTKPSLSVNLETGLYKCHAQSCDTNNDGNGGGNIYQFHMAINSPDMTYDQAKEELQQVTFKKKEPEPEPEEPKEEKKAPEAVKKPKPLKDFPISDALMEERHQALMGNAKIIKGLADRFRWTEDTCRRFQLGWDGNRIWIPIRDDVNRLVNIKRYAPRPKDGNKFLNISGFGQARLFPITNLSGEEIYLFEGEKDCILANQLGLNAISVTGGAGTWRKEWLPLFLNKSVYICYDIDEAGLKGARKIGEILSQVARVKLIKLPMQEPSNADFSDYIIQGNTVQDFVSLIGNSEDLEPPEKAIIDVPDDVVEEDLCNVVSKKMFHRRIKTRLRVIGKRDLRFMAPKKIRLKCNRDNSKGCVHCGLYGTADKTLVLDERRTTLLEFISSSSKDKRRLYQELFNLSPCRRYEAFESEHQYLEDVAVIPTVDDIAKQQKDTDSIAGVQSYEEHHLYALNQHLEMNTDYEVEIVLFSHPTDNHIVMVAYKIRPCESSLDEFKMTPELKGRLEVFQCKSKKN